MKLQIINSQISDLSKIFDLYRQATTLMKSKNQVSWPNFTEDLIVNEIKENRQWKLIIEDQIACIWATTKSDPLIWGSANETPSVYIHRIATDSNFRGRNLVKEIITWANVYGKKENLEYIRLDTVGNNLGLIKHYTKLGFDFLGTKKLDNTEGLPAHYKEDVVCYFQKEIN